VPHHSRLEKVVIDAADTDHDRELDFWQAAIGQPLTRFEHHPEYHGAVLAGRDFGVLVQRLGDGASRVHLDIHTDDLDAEVERLEQLGATRVDQIHGWWVMRDPAGLPFCVLPVAPGRLTDANARRWD
jgi:Glyoxalase-like domain